MKNMTRFALAGRMVVAALLGMGLIGPASIMGQELDTDRPGAVLRFEYQAGKTYTQKTTMDQRSKVYMGGQEVDQNMKMDMELSMEVEAVPGSTDKKIATTYDRVAMEMEVMGQKMGFDSEKPDAAANPMLANLGLIVGKTFTMTMNDKNEIVEVEGLEELMEQASANPMSAQMVKQYLDKDQLSQMMSTWVTQSFPEKEVKPGDSWPVDIEWKMAQMGNVDYKGTYTLKGYKDFNGGDCMVIDMDADLNLDFDGGDAAGGDDEGISAMFKQLGMKMSDGKTKATMYWDNELGWMRGMDMEQTMTMTMTNPQDGSKLEVPMRQELSMTIDVADSE